MSGGLILDTDESAVLGLAQEYFIGARRWEVRIKTGKGQAVLLRYYAGKALIPIRDRKKSDPQHNWMQYIEKAEMNYDTVNNSIRLAEAVDREIDSKSFSLKDLAKYTWNAALRRFGIKGSSRKDKTPFDHLTSAIASLDLCRAGIEADTRDATDPDQWQQKVGRAKETLDFIENKKKKH
jgi:hypothetical protein